MLAIFATSFRGTADDYRQPEHMESADRTTLRQTLINLLDNAIKYTPEQGDMLVRVEANGGRIELESDVDRGSTFRIVLPGLPTR